VLGEMPSAVAALIGRHLGGTLSFASSATHSSPPDTYPINPSGLTSSNYTITFLGGTLTIAPAPLAADGVDFVATAGAPFSGAVASFTNADPSGGPNAYTATITWGDGNTSAGAITDPGSGPLLVSGSNTFADPHSYAVQVMIQHKLGYTASSNTYATATVSNFNGGPDATALANWLALTFPNLYGSGAGGKNLFGKSNADVAAFYLHLFDEHGAKLGAQVLTAALNVYATTLSLGGAAAQAYGFKVTAFGLGASSFNVGSDGAAFSVPNHTVLNVYQILAAVNKHAVNGVLYDGDAMLGDLANDLFEVLNKTREGG
jgi:hypothetical protein